MDSYLQQYGAGDEKRSRVIKIIVLSVIAILLLTWAAYLVFHNYPEKQVVKHFLGEVNSAQYQQAYRDWGCTTAHPCPNYDYQRFLEDWGPPKKISSPWQIANVDGCKSFVTVNVQAQGAELQSLSVQRDDHELGFAPAPECQEKQWHWKQFFQRLIGHGKS